MDLTKNITLVQLETANEIFEKLVTAKNIKSGKKFNWRNLKIIQLLPKSGDLLIYKSPCLIIHFLYGHVAVIVNVNIEKGFVDLAEGIIRIIIGK